MDNAQRQRRSTKIVATLGPGSDSLIANLVQAGVDVFRLNFSHGSHEEHAARIDAIRSAADKSGRFVAILGDLQGPKIRTGAFSDGPVMLNPGDAFDIDPTLPMDAGTVTAVGTDYPALADDVETGDRLVLGDGVMELEVTGTDGQRVKSRVVTGGELSDFKGINLRGGGLSAPALTLKDRLDLAFACEHGIDYIAVSFVRSEHDMHEVRSQVRELGASCGVVAKIERAEAVASDEELDRIIRVSDAVMVARGDLGIEIGDAALVGMQKNIIHRARDANKCVITATQMMESMIQNPQPTRAEVMDVANAVLDGTDAVMLSAETAVGSYPVETVKAVARIALGAEASQAAGPEPVHVYHCEAIDESVAMAAMTIADNLAGVEAVVCLTATGSTPKLMSRSRSNLPIYALADNPRTLARVALYRGVHPWHFDSEAIDYDLVNQAAVQRLKDDGVVVAGDRVILSKGDYRNVQGGTNTLKIVEVTDE